MSSADLAELTIDADELGWALQAELIAHTEQPAACGQKRRRGQTDKPTKLSRVKFVDNLPPRALLKVGARYATVDGSVRIWSGSCWHCEHGRQRYRCKECGGASICEHGRPRHRCKECGGASICEHGRLRHRCKECGGVSICEHGRRRHACKECGGASICEHGKRRGRCKHCLPL